MMKFNGSNKQNVWAERIIAEAGLSDEQAESLLWYGGPTMLAEGICDVRIVIEHRTNLRGYADSLIRLRGMDSTERHNVAVEACDAVR